MEQKNKRTKFGIGIFALLLLVLSMTGEVSAATFNEINADSMFFKQNTTSTCTLSSAAMMVRRAAYMNGNSGWSGVTENNMKSTAWSSGLINAFSYAGINVSATGGTSNLSAVWYKSSADKKALFQSLLAQHPEGIVMYCKKSNNINDSSVHAVLLTDYTNGVFYCADPSSKAASGRIPLSSATVNMDYAFKYWYVSSPKLNLSAEDTIPPTISNVKITDVSKDGYTVTCQVTDSGGAGIDRVQFPTWTANNDQDDLLGNWGVSSDYRGIQNENIWTYRVDANMHNNEEGWYSTHIYAWDKAGNSRSVGTGVWIDRTAPTISDAKVIAIDATGYTVQCTVTDDSGISKVQFPTWTEKNGQDDLTASWWDNPVCTGTASGSVYTFRVNDSAHNYERGMYYTHIYAYDTFGNRSSYGLNNIDFQNTYQAVNITTYNGNTYRLYNDYLTWDDAKKKCEELGGHLVTITSAEEQEVIAQLCSSQARPGYWIGGRKNGNSEWVTGENFSYTNWASGEPNEWNGENSYGIYSTMGTWNDWFATDLDLGFICEWEKNDETSDTPTAIKVNAENVSLSKTSVSYNGKMQKPAVVAKNSKGDKIDSKYYTVKYSNNKKVGKATVTVTFRGKYTGTVKKTFTIVPKKTTVFKVTANRKEFTVRWKKQDTQTTGYEIQYSTSSWFVKKKTDTVLVNRSSSTSKKITKLKAKKKYYVRIRTYKTVKVNGKSTKIYSGWSKSKSVITKK